MDSRVLDRLLEIKSEKKIPMHIEIGKRNKEYDGNELVDIVYEYDYKDNIIINEAISRAINITFDLVDN